MPRPKRPAHLRYVKDSFSGPAYVVLAARLAAGAPEKEFSPWLVAALTEKLVRERPDLLKQCFDTLKPADYPEYQPQHEEAAEPPGDYKVAKPTKPPDKSSRTPGAGPRHRVSA